MKKVGILTFHRANNYGAVLQAYALKAVLHNLNCNSKIINYTPKMKQKFIHLIKNLIKTPFNFLLYIKFNSFRKTFLTDTKRYYAKDLKNLVDYSFFITGSDQVFNPNITNFDQNYFLVFTQNNKKYSYAGSFGKSILNEKEKQFITPLLKDFTSISVREQDGVKILKKLLDKEVYTHVDPIFLLDKNKWIKISNIVKKQNYILVYLMNNDGRILNFVDKLSKTLNCNVIIITTSFKEFIYNKHTIIPTPQEWLGYFLNAEYIVTNSFHGLAFSINLNKTFFCDISKFNNNVNSRLENLLDLTNLKDRLIDNIGTNYDKPINWQRVNKIIEQERTKSIEYLRQIINKNE